MKNNGRVYAFDLYKGKVGLIRSGAKRLGLSCIDAAVQDARQAERDAPMGDYVLCDAPCSGLGIVKRKPEIRYKDLDTIAGLPALQRNPASCVGADEARRVPSLFYLYLEPGGKQPGRFKLSDGGCRIPAGSDPFAGRVSPGHGRAGAYGHSVPTGERDRRFFLGPVSTGNIKYCL